MRKLFSLIYSLFRIFIFILYISLWGSALVEFLNEGDIGGFLVWIAFGVLFYFILFGLIFRSPKRKRRYSHSSGGGSVGGDYNDSFWDSSDSGSSDGGGGDGGGD